MNEQTKHLIKDTLAILGGVFTILALIEPWITEKYHLLRLKGLITVIVLFVLYRLVVFIQKRTLKYSLGGIGIAGLVALWGLVPTFPMNLLEWVPTPEEREFLEFNDKLSSLDTYKVGMIHILNNKQPEAKEAFEKAIEDERLKPYALNRLAFVERLLGNDNESLKLYDEAIKFSKKAELSSEKKILLSNNWQNRGFLYRRLAHAARDDKTKWSSFQRKAFQSFQNSVEHDPKFFKSWYMMGQIHYDRGELEAAKDAYYRAYFLNSQYDRAAYNLASLEADMGNLDQSLHWIKRTLQIDATQAYAIEEDESFIQLRPDERFVELIEDAKERLAVVYRDRLDADQKASADAK